MGGDRLDFQRSPKGARGRNAILRELREGDALTRALEAREAFLESLSPERLREALAFQEELEATLRKAGSPHNRLTVISELLMESVRRLSGALGALGAPAGKRP